MQAAWPLPRRVRSVSVDGLPFGQERASRGAGMEAEGSTSIIGTNNYP